MPRCACIMAASGPCWWFIPHLSYLYWHSHIYSFFYFFILYPLFLFQSFRCFVGASEQWRGESIAGFEHNSNDVPGMRKSFSVAAALYIRLQKEHATSIQKKKIRKTDLPLSIYLFLTLVETRLEVKCFWSSVSARDRRHRPGSSEESGGSSRSSSFHLTRPIWPLSWRWRGWSHLSIPWRTWLTRARSRTERSKPDRPWPSSG